MAGDPEDWPIIIAPGAFKDGPKEVPMTLDGKVVGTATVNENGEVTHANWEGRGSIELQHIAGTDYLLPNPNYVPQPLTERQKLERDPEIMRAAEEAYWAQFKPK